MLYAGLMLTAEGPKVIEYNVRFGDPEAQVVLPLLAGDAAELFLAVANGALDEARRRRSPTPPRCASCWPSPGYPERPRIGDAIEGLGADGQSVADVEGVTVFHAGTGRARRGRPVPHRRRSGARRHGGRADPRPRPGPTPTPPPAPIDWEGMQLRRDIAAQAAGAGVPAREAVR